MNRYQYSGLLAEKVAAEHPIEFFEEKPLDKEVVKELAELNKQDPERVIELSEEETAYWQAQKALMVKTMEESKARTGRY